MSIYKARQMFDDALKYINAHDNPAAHDLHAGLFQLAEGLEYEIRQLHAEIAHLSQQVAEIARRQQ